MIDFNAVRISLQEWIVRNSGLPDNKVVFEDQSAPRPAKPYISMKVSSIVDIGQEDARGSIDDDGDSIFTGNREFTLGMSSYGDDALNVLSMLRDSFNSPTELQTLRDNGVVFVDQLLFTDITELLETIWEERGQFDILMRTTSLSTHQVGIIDRVFIDSTYRDRQDTVTLVENIVVVTDPDALGGEILEVSPILIPLLSEGPNIAGDPILVNGINMPLVLESPTITINIPDPYYSTIIADGPVAYWRLGESSGIVAVDDIGVLTVDGDYNASPTLGVTSLVANTPDTAVSFTGTSKVINCGSLTDFQFIHETGVFSVEFWFSLDNIIALQNLIGTGTALTDTGFEVIFAPSGGGFLRFALLMNGGSFTILDTATGLISAGVTYHLVVTGDGVTARLYLDAVEKVNGTFNAFLASPHTDKLNIAASKQIDSVQGDMDEVAIYDKKLTPTQVLTHRNAGI